MKKFISLVKTQLNMNFGLSALKYRFTKEKKKRWEPILIGFAIIVGFGPLLALYVLAMTGLFAAGVTLNHPEIILTIAFIASQFVVLFFGMFYIMGNFYFSQDLDTLVPLPLKPYEVIGSKFIVVMINEYLTALPLLLPPFIIYGIGTGQGIVYMIKGILLILTAPVIPLTIGAVFMMLLMRVVNLKKSKDLLAIIGGFAGVIIALGVNLFFQRMPKNFSTQDLGNLLSSQTGLINEIGRKFPPSIWATLGLSDNGPAGLGYTLLFVGVSAVLFAALLWLSNLVFYKALIAGQEVSRKRKTLTGSEMAKQYTKVSNPVQAIFMREWKLLMRTPLYVINGLTGALLGPFLLLVMFFTQGQNSQSTGILELVLNPTYTIYVMLGGLGITLFVSGINVVASTSVSREGQNFWIAKMIPVSAKQQVLGKFYSGFAVSVIGVISTGVMLGIFAKLSILRLLTVLVLGLLVSVSMTALNLALDVIHPKLVWNSPQEAMKQNANSMLGMLVSIVVILVLAAAAVGMVLLQAPEWLTFAGLGIIAVILAVPSMYLLFALAEKRYREIEV